MTEFHKMNINELHEQLSKAVHSSGISPVEAILHSKTTMHLCSEIGIFKEALCIQADKIQKSNEKLARSQKIYSFVISFLTLGLVVVGFLNYFVMIRQVKVMEEQARIMEEHTKIMQQQILFVRDQTDIMREQSKAASSPAAALK